MAYILLFVRSHDNVKTLSIIEPGSLNNTYFRDIINVLCSMPSEHLTVIGRPQYKIVGYRFAT